MDIVITNAAVETEKPAAIRIADLLSKLIYGSLLALIVVAAMPYGTAQPWWKALFICAVFSICILAIIQVALAGPTRLQGSTLILPLMCLTLFALFQTISVTGATPIGGTNGLMSWTTISADPYQTRFFALQLLSLTTCLALFYRYASTGTRMRILVWVILAVATASAIFGILRQTTQQGTGFIIPLLEPGQGYGQFINRNHFAYLMEMAFGLGLGIMLAGGVKRDQVLIHVALLLPIWTALVLSNSRGGILAMFTQIIFGALLLARSSSSSIVDHNKLTRIQSSRLVKAGLVVTLVLGLVAGTIWVGGDPLVKSFQSVSNELNPETQTPYTGASRNEIWRATLKMFAANPIFGVGLGGYWIGITAYHDASGLVTPQEAHNDYLELLSSGGLVGFALGVWFAVSAFRKIKMNLKYRTGFPHAVCVGAIVAIAGVAVHSIFDFGLHILINAIVLMALLMMATTEVQRENRSS